MSFPAIDPRFFTALISANALVIALAVLLVATGYPRAIARSLQVFAIGKILVAIGVGFIVLRDTLPPLITVILANSIAMIGVYTSYPAIRILRDKPFNLFVPLGLFLCVVLVSTYYTYVTPDLRGIRFIVSLASGVVMALMTVELLLHSGEEGRAHIIGGWSCLFLGLCFLFRAVHQITGAEKPESWNLLDLVERLFLVSSYFAAILSTVCMILLSNDTFNAELRRLATADPLTGIANRRRFIDIGTDETRRAVRFRRPFAIMIIDIDFFKRINDNWGHAMGDVAITAVASSFCQQVRDIDLVSRLGGEEYGIILPNTELSSALEIAERLRNSIAALSLRSSTQEALPLTVSIGVAQWQGEDHFNKLVERADAAMYESKRSGRNRVSAAPTT